MAPLAEGLLFHQHLAEAHVDRALDLADHQQRVDGLADVVGDPHLVDADDAGLPVGRQLHDAGRVRVGRRRAHARALPFRHRPRRRVGADRAQRAELRLREHDRVRESQRARRIVSVEDAAGRGPQATGGHLELLRRRPEDLVADPARGLDGGVPGHERDPRRVRSEVDRREVGVGGDDADVLGPDPELLGHDVGEHRVGALADVRGAAEHGHAAAAIHLDLHAGVGHGIPVDGQARAADVGRRREADATARTEPPPLPREAAALHHALQALAEADRAHLHLVRGDGTGRQRVAKPPLRRVEPELVAELVDVALERVPRLRRAVAALGTAGRLVGEDPHALELVARDPVRHRLQSAGVVEAGHTVAAVGAAVEGGAEVHGRDRAVALQAGLDPHRHRVAPPVAVEDLLAVERDLHGTPRLHRELGRDDLVAERVRLAAEAAAVGARDDPDVRGGHFQHLGQGAVDVVRRLGRRPQRELPVRAQRRQRRVLLHGQVRVAFEEERVLAEVVGLGEAGLDVPEVERHLLVHVAARAVVVDAGVGPAERLVDRHDRRQHLVVDLDELQRLLRRLLVERGHRRHRVADEAHLVQGERVLVLAHRQDAEGDRELGPDERRRDTPVRGGPRHVDAPDSRVRVRRAQETRV